MTEVHRVYAGFHIQRITPLLPGARRSRYRENPRPGAIKGWFSTSTSAQTFTVGVKVRPLSKVIVETNRHEDIGPKIITLSGITTITITGEDIHGNSISDTIDIPHTGTDARGEQAPSTGTLFARVTQVDVPEYRGDGGLLRVGLLTPRDTHTIDAIKAKFLSDTSAQSFSGSELNGSIGGDEMYPARNIVITTNDSTDIDAVNVTITGEDRWGNVITEDITLTDDGGTVSGSKAFRKVTQVDVPAQSGTGGVLEIGTGRDPFVEVHEPPGLLDADGNSIRIKGNTATNVDTFVVHVEDDGDGREFHVELQTGAHYLAADDSSSHKGKHTSLRAKLEESLNQAHLAHPAPGPGDFSVSWDNVNLAFTISRGSGATLTLNFSETAQLILGMDESPTPAANVSSARTPYYVIAAERGVSRMEGNREPQQVGSQYVTDSGDLRGISPVRRPKRDRFMFRGEPTARTHKHAADSSSPWTWEHLFEHVAIGEPILLVSTEDAFAGDDAAFDSTETLMRAKLMSRGFRPDETIPNRHTQWDVPLEVTVSDRFG